jgi:hypothetical protein
MEAKNLPETIETNSFSMFQTKESFEHIQRVATMFSKSELVPKKYQGNVGNCVIALEMANRMGASPLMVMQNLDVIQGKPGWSSKFLIATLNSCGKFSPLRYEEDDKNGGRTRAWAYDLKNNEKVFGTWISMEMAKAETWIDKAGSKWKTMPEHMRKYRAASFFVNEFAPDVSMGLQTIEEVYDITPMQNATVLNNEDKENERIELMIGDCITIEDLELIQSMITPDMQEKFNERKEEITNGK